MVSLGICLSNSAGFAGAHFKKLLFGLSRSYPLDTNGRRHIVGKWFRENLFSSVRSQAAL